MHSRVSPLLLAVLLVVALPAQAAMNLDDLLFYGTESLARGRFDQASQAFGEALARDPENAYAKGRLALSKAAAGRIEEARRLLTEAVAARGDDLFALWTLGCLDLLEGAPGAAADSFAAMAKADPGNVRASLGLGLAALAAGHTAEGLGHLAVVQARPDSDPLAHALAGLALFQAGAPAGARLELETALELDPRNAAVLDQLGLVYKRLGKTGLAKSAWEQALAVDGEDARARFYLSRLAEDEGLAASLSDRPEEAKRAYERALALDPTNAAAAKALGLPVPMAPPAAPTGETAAKQRARRAVSADETAPAPKPRPTRKPVKAPPAAKAETAGERPAPAPAAPQAPVTPATPQAPLPSSGPASP